SHVSDPAFFFSSRGRHTRFSRDWSSDVCSSDLGHPLRADGEVVATILARESAHGLRTIQFPDPDMPTYVGFYLDGRRGYFAPEDGRTLLMRSTDDDFLLWLQDLHIHFLSGEAGEQVGGVAAG